MKNLRDLTLGSPQRVTTTALFVTLIIAAVLGEVTSIIGALLHLFTWFVVFIGVGFVAAILGTLLGAEQEPPANDNEGE